jgi:predicted nucleic acid-binding protein
MSYLFDSNAISEVFRPRPNELFTAWLQTVAREDQYTTTLVLGELYTVAYRSKAREKWMRRIEGAVLPAMTILTMDIRAAQVYGEIRGQLMNEGRPVGDADLQIAACALRYELTLVTANVKHFERVPGLNLKRFAPGRQGT